MSMKRWDLVNRFSAKMKRMFLFKTVAVCDLSVSTICSLGSRAVSFDKQSPKPGDARRMTLCIES